MSNLKKYESQMEKLLNDNAAMISKCEKRIEELNGEIETAGADMLKATETVDTDAFKVAKKRKDDAELELGMLQNSLKKLTEDPLMSVEEFEAMRRDLLAEQEQYTKDRIKKYAPLIRDMLADKKAAGELDDRIEKNLNVLHKQVMRITNNQKLPKELEKYRYTVTQLSEYPVFWFLSNLENAAGEIGIE